MVQKPITVAREDYMKSICDLTNQSGLPAFVVVDILDDVISEMKRIANTELQRDTANYRAALIRESEEKSKEGETVDGGQENQ